MKLKAVFFVVLLGVWSSACFEDCSPTNPGSFNSNHKSNEVWVTPNVGSRDMLDLFTEPDKWANARAQITIFGFAYYHTDFPVLCPFCGRNTLSNFLTVVPGGAFRWLTEHGIKIAIETGSVKPYDCERENVDEIVQTKRAIGNVQSSGGIVNYIAMDEPFATGQPVNQPWGDKSLSCNLTVQENAKRVKTYIDEVTAEYPGVQIGDIEPYPYFSAQQIQQFIQAMLDNGTRLAFFHLDYDPNSNEDNQVEDIRALRNFCRQNGIPFGIIIIGANGSSNETAASGFLLHASRVQEIIGIHDQEHIHLETWADSFILPSTDANTKLYPDNLPESDPTTMMGLVPQILSMQ